MWTTFTSPSHDSITYELKTKHAKALLATHKDSTEYSLIMVFDNIENIHRAQFTSDNEADAKRYAKECMRYFLNTKIQEIEEMRHELL